MQTILDFIPKLLGLGPSALALIGAVVTLLVAVQAFCLFVAGVSGRFPRFSGFFGAAASGLGVAVTDLRLIASGIMKLLSGLGGKPPNGGAAVGIVFLVLGVTGCTAQQVADVTSVANDVVKIATVLCENDQAFIHKITPKDAGLFCKDAEQLAPYMAIARRHGPDLAACAR